MAIIIGMNRAGKRAWRQCMRGCSTVAERVRYEIILAWAAPDPSTHAVAEKVGCAPSMALWVAHRYQTDGEAGLWDRRRGNGTCKVTEALVGDVPQPMAGPGPSSTPSWTPCMPISPITITCVPRSLAPPDPHSWRVI